MRNPFHFFRKNQKALLAVFGVLLMIVFTIGGVVTSFFPQRAAFEAEDKTVVKIDGTPLTAPEIDRLRQDASLVSLITGLAIARTQEVGGFPNPPSPPISGLRYQPASGPNSPGGPMREEISTRQVITDHLFSLEGERLGIAISDDVVRDFMTSVTGGSISSNQYNELLAQAQGNEGNITYDQMFEMFRRVIQVQKTKRLLLEGVSTATPASAWINFRNLNRTIDVQLYPVNTSDYLAKVKQNPTNADLRKLFNKFNDQIRNPQTGDPGFLQLDKAAVAYVKADYDKFLQAELAKISDEQVAEYYEKNKDSSFRKPVADPVAPMNQPAPEEKPSEEKPAAEAPADDKPAEEPKMEAPATEEKPAEPATEEKPAEPATEEKPAEPAPMTDKPAEEAPAAEKPAAEEKPATETPAEEKPAEEKPADEKPAEEESSFLSTGREAMLVAFQEETTEEKPAEETPAEEKPADDKPAAEAPMNEAPADDAKPMEEAAAPMGETPAAEQPPVEYRPLEEVKEQIKTSIARPLAQASVKAALQNVADILKREYDDYFYLDEEDKTGTPFDKLDLKKLAQQNGLEYGEMPKMDYIAAMESPYGTISHAEFSFNPQQGGLQRNDLRLIDAIFGKKDQLYSPQEFPGTSSTSMFSMPADQQFVYWKTDFEDGYVPTFEDVKDQVADAWKEQQAAELAKAEAEKIAASAKGDAPLNEVVPAKDAVIVADNITYYQEIRQPGQYLPAEIPGVEKTGIETLDTIFAAPVGETFVVPNADKSVWYVARVTGERKTEAELREQLKSEMNGEYPFSVVYLEGMRSQIRWSEVQEELFERFNVEWQRIPEN